MLSSVSRASLSEPHSLGFGGLRHCLIQVADEGVHIDAVSHCALLDILKARDSTTNASQAMLEKDIDRGGILADYVANRHIAGNHVLL